MRVSDTLLHSQTQLSVHPILRQDDLAFLEKCSFSHKKSTGSFYTLSDLDHARKVFKKSRKLSKKKRERFKAIASHEVQRVETPVWLSLCFMWLSTLNVTEKDYVPEKNNALGNENILGKE